jgi:hypothetical protein
MKYCTQCPLMDLVALNNLVGIIGIFVCDNHSDVRLKFMAFLCS